MSVTKSISLGAAVVEFRAVYMPSKNYALETQRGYDSDVTELVENLIRQGIEYADEVAFGHLSRFVQEHRGRGLRDSTRARKIFSIKVFFGYLEEFGYIGRNPTNQLIAPQVERFPTLPTSTEELEQQLAATKNPRDKAMLLLLEHTQIRQKELVALTLDDLQLSAETQVGDMDAGTISVSRSNGQQHFTLDYRCWSALQQWLPHRDKIIIQKATTERSVFLNRFGRRMSTRAIRYNLVRFLK